jgi:RluA family pseudouridine synthase
MAKPRQIELPNGMLIPILYEDRSVMAIDKPAGWLLAPDSWERTGRNLQLALNSSIQAGDFWARSRNLKYLRFIHRLDAETSGLLLMAKSPGAMSAFSRLFETRQVEKKYLAVVHGVPVADQWVCRLKIGPEAAAKGRMKIDARAGKDAETQFQVVQRREQMTLVEARPATGRTHQIRVHLAAGGHPVLGDRLYGKADSQTAPPNNMALRAVALVYPDPFQKRPIRIAAPVEEFLRAYGFESALAVLHPRNRQHNVEL